MAKKSNLDEMGMKMLTALIPEELHRKIKVTASLRGEKLKEYVTRVLEEAVKRDS
jgi:predicted HicB family RNase H-like nuclease